MRSYILKVIDTGTAIRVTRKFYKISRKLITAFHASVELVLMPPFPLSNISIIPLTSDKTRYYIVANIRVLVAFTCGNLYRDTFVPPVSLSWSGIFIENGIFIQWKKKKKVRILTKERGGEGRLVGLNSYNFKNMRKEKCHFVWIIRIASSLRK